MTGIEAAWAENRKEGFLSVVGRSVQYRRDSDGMTWRFHAHTPKDAETQIRLFRAALKRPETRPVVDEFSFNHMD